MRGEIVEEPPWSEYEKDPLTKLIQLQDGVIAWSQARQFLSEKAIRHRVARGTWRRTRIGVYVAYGGPLTLRQRQWIAVLTGGESACLGGLSALQVHGLQRVSARQIDVVVDVKRQVSAPPGVIIHRSLLADDRHPYSQPPTTTVARAVIDAAAWARSDDEARLVVAASFQQGLVRLPELLDVTNRRLDTPRRRLVVTTAHDAAGGSHSIGELLLVTLCRDGKLPLPTRQVRFQDATGRTRYLDAVFDPWRVGVEVDGAHHDGVEQRWDDMDRENAAVLLAQLKILRYPVYALRSRRKEVAADIRLALLAAGWRP